MTAVQIFRGTWHADKAWGEPGSEFVRRLDAMGYRVLGVGMAPAWRGRLEGVIGADEKWHRPARAWAKTYGIWRRAHRHDRLVWVAHSHGGTVALWAAAEGAEIDLLITGGTPVRPDLTGMYAEARQHIGQWIHVYSTCDRWQWLGSQRLIPWRVVMRPERQFTLADENVNTEVPGLHNPFDVSLWDRHGWWEWIA